MVCHDILGQTALVDLAGLRDAVAEKGGDPSKVNPVVPTQLIVDHSLAVEHAGYEKDAFAKNRAIEDRRNDDRFHFIDWTKNAFENVDVIPPGNGIMHQINLERMSPVIHARDGVAFPDTLVGTDSHTPHVDALGVIAIGVGGLEAESVMLGRASYMRLPDIIGVELVGVRQEGITATDIVLAITEFLRKERVVSSYLEFFGEGADALTLADRATISNMTPEFGQVRRCSTSTTRPSTIYGSLAAAMSRSPWSKPTPGKQGCGQKICVRPNMNVYCDLIYRVLDAISPAHQIHTVGFQLRDLAAQGISGLVESEAGTMPDGAIIIAAITSCTNTSNPRNVIAAGLLARKANAKGLSRKPWVKSSLAPGSKAVQLYLQDAKLLPSWSNLVSALWPSPALPVME